MNIRIPKILTFRNKRQFNPNKIWTIFCIAFITIVIVLLGYFSWYFLKTADSLDAPITTTFETNASKIASMQKMLDEIDRVVQNRIGQ